MNVANNFKHNYNDGMSESPIQLCELHHVHTLWYVHIPKTNVLEIPHFLHWHTVSTANVIYDGTCFTMCNEDYSLSLNCSSKSLIWRFPSLLFTDSTLLFLGCFWILPWTFGWSLLEPRRRPHPQYFLWMILSMQSTHLNWPLPNASKESSTLTLSLTLTPTLMYSKP